MADFSEKSAKILFKKRGIQPSKGLGQHFLIDKGVLKKVLEAADIRPSNIVLEIGPGTGILTVELAKRAKRVIAIEKDPKMADILKENIKSLENVEIIIADVLKTSNTIYKIQNTRYKVVANLPYYITSPIIRKFLESENPPSQMVLMVQKEVAKRIAARPPDMSLLAASVQFYAKAKIISFVSKKSFWPQPKVDSAIIKISNIKKEQVPPAGEQKSKIFRDLFFRIVRAGFSQPRKQILNNLAKKLALSPPNGLKLNKEFVKNWLLKNKISPRQRAETLNVADWIGLAETFRQICPKDPN